MQQTGMFISPEEHEETTTKEESRERRESIKARVQDF
jgi:hypothetical protein